LGYTHTEYALRSEAIGMPPGNGNAPEKGMSLMERLMIASRFPHLIFKWSNMITAAKLIVLFIL